MECDCLTAQLVKKNAEQIWKKFNSMSYGYSLVLKIQLPECGCTDENCFDCGTRKVYLIRKTEKVEVESYFKKEERERKPGLEFYEKCESWYKEEEKWDTNLSGEWTILKLQFNEKKHTVKISHYEGVFEKERELVEKFLN